MVTRRLGHWALQNTYYIRPLYQDWETYQFYLIHKNKYVEAAKMKRQKNMSQMKEQNSTPEKELNKMEIRNLLDAEFKTLALKVLNKLKGRVDELSENLHKEIGNIKWR